MPVGTLNTTDKGVANHLRPVVGLATRRPRGLGRLDHPHEVALVDESGVGGFGLTGDSRREFFQAVERIYSSSGALGADRAESAERLAR